MTTELRLAAHKLIGDQQMIEVWYDGKFIAGIYTAKDGAIGIDITTKHQLAVSTPVTVDGLSTVQARITL